MHSIEFIVKNRDNEHCHFRRSLDVPDGVVVDFNQIVCSLKTLLQGLNFIISFNFLDFLIMKQKKLVLTFQNERGETISELCKNPARGEDVMAAMSFLDTGRSILIEVVDFDFDVKHAETSSHE